MLSLTETIEKGLKDLIGGKWGNVAGKTYLRFSKPLNFVIVVGIGALLSMILSGVGLVAVVVEFGWDYVMTVGPLGHLWGFAVVHEESIHEETHEESDEMKKT